MQVNLKNQVALVTGAAQGIGRSIAETLAANGARVVFSDVDVAQAEEAAAAHDGCVAWELDVTDEQRVLRVVADVVSEFGQLDIVVNNAGVNTLAHRVTIDCSTSI
jgi:NAD(P)-dependent dehydrogenase (short-subunit alcohol dehydrogenase family)